MVCDEVHCFRVDFFFELLAKAPRLVCSPNFRRLLQERLIPIVEGVPRAVGDGSKRRGRRLEELLHHLLRFVGEGCVEQVASAKITSMLGTHLYWTEKSCDEDGGREREREREGRNLWRHGILTTEKSLAKTSRKLWGLPPFYCFFLGSVVAAASAASSLRIAQTAYAAMMMTVAQTAASPATVE